MWYILFGVYHAPGMWFILNQMWADTHPVYLTVDSFWTTSILVHSSRPLRRISKVRRLSSSPPTEPEIRWAFVATHGSVLGPITRIQAYRSSHTMSHNGIPKRWRWQPLALLWLLVCPRVWFDFERLNEAATGLVNYIHGNIAFVTCIQKSQVDLAIYIWVFIFFTGVCMSKTLVRGDAFNFPRHSIWSGPKVKTSCTALFVTRLFHVGENYSSLWSCLLSIHPSWTAIVPKHPSFIRFNPVMYKPDFPAVILISTQLVHPRY